MSVASVAVQELLGPQSIETREQAPKTGASMAVAIERGRTLANPISCPQWGKGSAVLPAK
jgi:hypothetical protein